LTRASLATTALAALLALPACGTDTIVAVREITASGSSGGSAGAGGAATGGSNPGGTAGTGGSPTGGSPTGGSPPSGMPGYLHTSGTRIVDDDGNPVRIRAVSWFGLETHDFAPHGLWSRTVDDLLDEIKELGFDTVRLPFSNQLFDQDSRAKTNIGDLNPDLAGIPGLSMLEHVVERAGAHGLRVILDRHDVAADARPGLWYDETYDDDRFVADWKMLAGIFRGNSTVFAFELGNDLHGEATWGDGNNLTDWRLAAERAGNAVLSVNPDVLVFVEGIEKVGDLAYVGGGNLAAAAGNPVRLSAPGKLVYAASDYPSTVTDQPWFHADDYPRNLPAVWDSAWGYLVEQQRAPVFLAGFGTRYQIDSDKAWLAALTRYASDLDIGFAYWALNPNSGDTAGLLKADWTTIEIDKLNALAPLLQKR
jgi:endoglucanase